MASDTTGRPLDTRYRLPAKLTPAQRYWRRYRYGVQIQDPGFTSAFTSSTTPSAIPAFDEGSRKARTAQIDLLNFFPRSPHNRKRYASSHAAKYAEKRRQGRAVLTQVKQSIAQREAKTNLRNFVAALFQAQTPLPREAELLRTVYDVFPKRMDIPVWICDAYADHGKVHISRIGEVEQFWKEKPSGVIVRWIHIPLGQGVLHSSIEDMFRHDVDQGEPYVHAGIPGFPYLEVDSLHFRQREDLEYLHDVRNTLKSLTHLSQRLSEECLESDKNETLVDDVLWREGYLGDERSFWEWIRSDIPSELAECLSFHGPLRLNKMGNFGLERSCIGTVDDMYDGAKLVVAPFRFFHRKDNILLSMSAATGVDQLHKDFITDVTETLEERLKCEDASVIANTMAWIRDTGVSQWHQKKVEYLVVWLATELGVAPLNAVGGRSAPSILSVLQNTVVSLKHQRYSDWESKKTMKLVHKFLVCMDDLTMLRMCYARKINLFERLSEDLAVQNPDEGGLAEDQDVAEGISSVARAKWAIEHLTDDNRHADVLFNDVKQALETLFKLRSIERNELIMFADIQNKALFVFTIVTVVFLPLSFFTSYYGMNLVGIRDTDWTEAQFWEIAGSVTFAALLAIILNSIRMRVQGSFWIFAGRVHDKAAQKMQILTQNQPKPTDSESELETLPRRTTALPVSQVEQM